MRYFIALRTMARMGRVMHIIYTAYSDINLPVNALTETEKSYNLIKTGTGW